MSVSVEGIEAVFAQHSGELLSFATTVVGPGDANDVVSNAVLRMLTSEVWDEARNPLSVLYKAVYFEALSWIRASRRRRDREARWASFTTASADPIVPFADSEVTALLGVLSVQQRAVIFLTYWCDLPPSEVSEMLGISDGATKKQLARARAKLRKVWPE